MSLAFNKRINKEILLYKKENFTYPNLIIQPTENLHEWYFIIYDLKDTDYEYGVYLGIIILPEHYPFKAPDFKFLTKNGRFELNKKICTSFTGFHQEEYSPAWNISSLCSALISFMTDSDISSESKGIGQIICSKKERQIIAKESQIILKTHPIIIKYFKEYINKIFL